MCPLCAQLLAGIRTQELLSYLLDFPQKAVSSNELSFSITAARQFWSYTRFPFK